MYGYGAYGMSTDPAFQRQPHQLAGSRLAYARYVRGGGEPGQSWYGAGQDAQTEQPNDLSTPPRR
ncbi:hypothetical protein M8494_03140 [Serratia ureilytica]